MFYIILSSILLTFFFAAGVLGCWSVYKHSKFFAPNWHDYLTAYIYFAVAVFCFIAAYLVGLQIPDCYAQP